MSLSSVIRVASAAYPVDFLENWNNYTLKLRTWVEEAAEGGAQLLLFPEYGAMELISLSADYRTLSLSAQLTRLQRHLDSYLDLHRTLAAEYGVYIVAGSIPVAVDGEFRNRAYLFAPDGGVDFQEKLQMTRFENELWGVSPGIELKVFDTDLGRLGINICYDSEFPLLARQQVEAGVDLILVPSCTDNLAGFNRVRIGCQARALENQCFVVQSPLVGDAPWSQAVDVNVGSAAFYCPVDRGYPNDGVLAMSELNTPGWTYRALDLGGLATVRDTGQVFNYRDWPEQGRAQLRTLSLTGQGTPVL